MLKRAVLAGSAEDALGHLCSLRLCSCPRLAVGLRTLWRPLQKWLRAPVRLSTFKDGPNKGSWFTHRKQRLRPSTLQPLQGDPQIPYCSESCLIQCCSRRRFLPCWWQVGPCGDGRGCWGGSGEGGDGRSWSKKGRFLAGTFKQYVTWDLTRPQTVNKRLSRVLVSHTQLQTRTVFSDVTPPLGAPFLTAALPAQTWPLSCTPCLLSSHIPLDFIPQVT